MALHTDISLRNKVIYCIFVRNHTGAGTFRALEADLDRLKALGTDILWLMPIYPIGVKNRKGTLGSPYAICDYRDFNPEYGTREDFLHIENFRRIQHGTEAHISFLWHKDEEIERIRNNSN